VEVVGVSKDYWNQNISTKALNNVSLKIEKGDFCLIVGPSGSGKSTLLYVMSGLTEPSSGDVQISGKSIKGISSEKMAEIRREEFGFVFQFFNLIPNLNVLDNVMLPQVIGHHIDENRALEVLRIVGMAEFKDRFPDQLSGGMRQKVAIARAIVNEPGLLFADEPTGNLDQKSGREIMELLQKLNHTNGITVVVVTHNPDHLIYGSRKVELLDGVVTSDEKL